MAKMKRNIGDSVSGKIGNVVFVQMGGNSYVISAPFGRKTTGQSNKSCTGKD